MQFWLQSKNEPLGLDKLFPFIIPYLYSLIGSCDESNKQWQHHVDEEWDEGVQVDLAEQPHQGAALLHPRKRHKHVVSVNEGEQTFWHHGQGTELRKEKTADRQGVG